MNRAFFYTILGSLVLLSACSIFRKSDATAEKGTPVNTGEITDRKWRLIELEGKPVADKINGKVPYILLQRKDSRYSATAGCNVLNGSFELPGNGRIRFALGISTMMACENMEIEQELQKVLETADNYSMGDHTMSLNKARMAPLARFHEIEKAP